MAASGKPDLIRRYNLDLIRNLIQVHGPVSKVELARLSGASVPTVNKIVNQLESEGVICRIDGDSNTVGRKAANYVVNKDAGFFIVFFVQNGSITAGLANNDGELIRKETFAPDMSSLDQVDSTLFRFIDGLLEEEPERKLNAVGLGVPGVLDAGGRIIAIPTVPCWEGFDIVSVLKEKYGVPVFIENDVKLMTVGVYKQEFADRCKNMVLLYVSQGLGAGIVINGRLYKGCRNFAGEYGFMLPDFENPVSHPDWTGDLELKLLPLVRKKMSGKALPEKDAELYTGILSGVITNFTAVLDPDVIAVCAPNLDERELAEIREKTLVRIPDSFMPELALVRGRDHGINGVIELCMAELTSKISLISETGL